MRSDAQILACVDHTLLKPEATWPQVQALCEEAVQYHTASVCLNGDYVRQAAEYLAGRVPVCCVVGFPLGAMASRVKCLEAEAALEDGAGEIDMVINVGRMKNGEYQAVQQEIAAVKRAVGDHILKVIIETCLLTDEEKIRMCEAVTKAGADYIKTSTGFSKAGATFEDIKLFSEHVGPNVKMKAAGGISSLDDAEKFLSLGADRLGTSRIIKLVKQEEATGY